MPIIVAFGNPLLDISVKIEGDPLLKKYNLKTDDQAQISEFEMQSLLNDIKNLPASHTLGGSVQNTLRVIQWLTYDNNYSTYMIGSIGNDHQGECIKELMTKDGVKTLYSISASKSTGVTVALIQNVNRSLVAYIGAAETFSIHDFQQVTENGKLIENADLYYIEGFFLTERHEVTTYIVDYVLAKKKLLMYNINAPYVCTQNPQMVKYVIDNCDILIGNIREFNALTDIYKPGISDPVELAKKLNESHRPTNNFKYGKIIVITDGPNPITCVYGDGKKIVLPIDILPEDKIKDTTGAGDAFVAGFLVGLFRDYGLEKCIRYGSWAATEIIQQVGCKIPDYLPEFNKRPL